MIYYFLVTVPIIGVVAFMAVPMTKAILSSMTPKDEQGNTCMLKL